ncbi:hypothetical protein E3N88_09065 [Mikania micrantha]|uniref:Uncharacterized protein n=1 Tax=Mikania micrantha TaxID=192012 RepID=A0A5N6PHZ5_9ASTR|nr:hypothetical protein E3N88_09065 [Mikania micrantha]
MTESGLVGSIVTPETLISGSLVDTNDPLFNYPRYSQGYKPRNGAQIRNQGNKSAMSCNSKNTKTEGGVTPSLTYAQIFRLLGLLNEKPNEEENIAANFGGFAYKKNPGDS